MVMKRGSKAVKRGKRVKDLPAKALQANQARRVKGGYTNRNTDVDEKLVVKKP